MRVSRQDEFLAIFNSLQFWLQDHSKVRFISKFITVTQLCQVRLIVIDSLSAPLRLAHFPALLPSSGPVTWQGDTQIEMRTHALLHIRRVLSTLCAAQNGYGVSPNARPLKTS